MGPQQQQQQQQQQPELGSQFLKANISHQLNRNIHSKYAYFAHETNQLTTLSLHKVPAEPRWSNRWSTRDDRWSRWSVRVGTYHRTNKLLFHVGPSFYKLLGGVFHVICVFYIYYLRI